MSDSARVASPAALAAVLRCLLAVRDGRDPALEDHVRAFMAYADSCGGELRCWANSGQRGLTAAFGALLLPGRVAMVLAPGAWGSLDEPSQAALSERSLAELRAGGLHYAQGLIEPAEATRAARLSRLGFARLTDLIYLERAVTYPWVDPPPATITWQSYSPGAHATFATVLERSYVSSSDCPELNGLRPVEDVIASHKAAGVFEAGLWQVGLIDGVPVGCVLLGRVARNTVEIVYVAVDPERRGQGLGAFFVRRAVELARAAQVEKITLAVDVRNSAARRLYGRCAFQELARRRVFLRRLGREAG